MAKLGQRVAVISLAVLFLLTSVGFSGLVVWEMYQQDKKDKATASVTDKLNQSTDINQPKPKEGSLEGTKLNGFEPVTKVTELQKIDTVVGTGAEAKAGDKVTAHYTGAVAATGVIFQSSLDAGQPILFGLDQVIKGWSEGVPGMKVGGKRRLVIPAELAYGANAPQGSGIPANADLVFDIELTKVGE
jgi:FKBP-type peptidyl-prolyl cis-trans isomerase